MNDPIPSPRDSAFDRLARHIEEMQDTRLREHHSMRRLHHPDADGVCVEDGQVCPCRSMQLIDGTETAVKT